VAMVSSIVAVPYQAIAVTAPLRTTCIQRRERCEST
jgi:hypothetical protein